jgi:hypothetical protein
MWMINWKGSGRCLHLAVFCNGICNQPHTSFPGQTRLFPNVKVSRCRYLRNRLQGGYVSTASLKTQPSMAETNMFLWSQHEITRYAWDQTFRRLHCPTWTGLRANPGTAVRGQRLTAWIIARPSDFSLGTAFCWFVRYLTTSYQLHMIDWNETMTHGKLGTNRSWLGGPTILAFIWRNWVTPWKYLRKIDMTLNY